MINNLEAYINELIKINKLYRFYKSREWLSLRAEVLAKAHNECVRCREKSPAEYTPAKMVHHVREVIKYPRLALSKTYTNEQGNTCVQLLPLCNECHEKEHNRFGKKEKPQLNRERW